MKKFYKNILHQKVEVKFTNKFVDAKVISLVLFNEICRLC